MAITRLYDFRGEAEVAGVMRVVRYRHDDGLTIEGLTLTEANDLLNALATGSLAGVEPRASAEREATRRVVHAEPGKPEPRPVADATAEKPRASAKEKPAAPAAETKAEKPAETKPAEAPAAETKTDEKPSNGATGPAKPAAAKPAAKAAKAPQQPAEAKAAPKAAPAAAAPPPPEEEPEEDEDEDEDDLDDDASGASTDDGNDGALIASLQDAKKLRDVVGALADAGITTPDALVAKALAIKDSVPLLKRIGDLDRRVRRTAAAMGIGDDAGGDDATA